MQRIKRSLGSQDRQRGRGDETAWSPVCDCRGHCRPTEGHPRTGRISPRIRPGTLPPHRLFQRLTQTYSKGNHNLQLEHGKSLNKGSAGKHCNQVTMGLKLNVYYQHGYTQGTRVNNNSSQHSQCSHFRGKE